MTTQPAGTARVLARRCHRVSRSAGDVEFVAHVDEPALRPHGADHRVVSNRCRFRESGGSRHAGQVSYEL